MSALVLGLLITSAKTTYETHATRSGRSRRSWCCSTASSALRTGDPARPRIAARVDGPVGRSIGGPRREVRDRRAASSRPCRASRSMTAIEALSPKNDVQRNAQVPGPSTTTNITEQRVLLAEPSDAGLPWPLLVMLGVRLDHPAGELHAVFPDRTPTSGVVLVIIACRPGDLPDRGTDQPLHRPHADPERLPAQRAGRARAL